MYGGKVDNLDNPPDALMFATTPCPTGFPSGFSGNGCFVIQHNPCHQKYTAQLAFGFGSDKVAIRRKNDSEKWTEWHYVTFS